MDEEIHHLEAELKQLRPVRPSDLLHARLAAELDRARPPGAARSSPWVWAVVVPLAAAIAILLAPRPPVADAGNPLARATPAELGAQLRPVSAENVLVSAVDEGLVTLDDGRPARRARLTYVDTITWRDPRTNASLTWTLPREEVRVVPVHFQ